MSKSVTISYNLLPPASISAQHLTTTKSQDIPVKNEQNLKSYYGSLREAIGEAKAILGSDLTAWRDAVGTAEQPKEVKRVVKEEDDDDDDEE